MVCAQDVRRDQVAIDPDPDQIIWVFRTTGRTARVVRVISYRDHDIVVFRFCGLPNQRTTTPKRFLADFVRLS